MYVAGSHNLTWTTFPAALDHAEHGCLLLVGPPLCFDLTGRSVRLRRLCKPALVRNARTTADVHLVHLDRAVQLHVAVVHQLVANEREHAPRRLVGDAQFSLQLLGRDAATSAGHEVHRIEPQVQRRGRLVEDRACRRVNVQSACRARPRLAGLSSAVALEGADLFALGAVSLVGIVERVARLPKPRQTGLVVREVSHELHEGV